jgi:hypothetical protein
VYNTIITDVSRPVALTYHGALADTTIRLYATSSSRRSFWNHHTLMASSTVYRWTGSSHNSPRTSDLAIVFVSRRQWRNRACTRKEGIRRWARTVMHGIPDLGGIEVDLLRDTPFRGHVVMSRLDLTERVEWRRLLVERVTSEDCVKRVPRRQAAIKGMVSTDRNVSWLIVSH